jgi:hypothetical protein
MSLGGYKVKYAHELFHKADDGTETPYGKVITLEDSKRTIPSKVVIEGIDKVR